MRTLSHNVYDATDSSSSGEGHAASSLPPPPAPLSRADDSFDVVDDESPRQQALAWARTKWLEPDADGDAIWATLVEIGWPSDEADEIVEQTRLETRDERGVANFDDSLRTSHRAYRRGNTGPLLGFAALASAWRLVHSIKSLFALRRRGGSR